MTESKSPLPLSEGGRARAIERVAIALVFAPLLLSAADDIQLIDPAQYAEIARRIVETGQLAHLHDNNGPYTDKPPITFWLIAACFKVLGLTPFAVRLPSLLLAAVLLGIVHGIGTELWDGATGRRAALLLGASVGFHLMVLDPKIDMVVTTFMAGAVYCAVLVRRRPAAIYGAWICAAGGVLTKGPIGLVAPVLALAPEALRRRWGDGANDRGLVDRLQRFRPLAGVGILALLIGPWLLESQAEFGAHGPLFLLWSQSFGRLFERSYRNDTTAVFFLHTALWAFLPFTLLLLDDFARRAMAWRRAGFRLPPDETRVVLWWLALTLIGISASSYKLPQYLFWLSPPAALLAARALHRLAMPETARRAVGWGRAHLGLGALGVALVGGLAHFAFVLPPIEQFAWMGVAALPVIVAIGVRRRVGPESAVALAVASASLGFLLFLSGSFHRHLLEFQPDRAFGLEARELDPRGTELPCIDTPATSAQAFAAQRSAVAMDPAQLVDAVREGQARVAITSVEAIPRIESAGLRVTRRLELPSFPTSRANGRFLNAATRAATLRPLALVEVDLGSVPAAH